MGELKKESDEFLFMEGGWNEQVRVAGRMRILDDDCGGYGEGAATRR